MINKLEILKRITDVGVVAVVRVENEDVAEKISRVMEYKFL